MTIPRFYCPIELSPGTPVELPPQAAHHAARVLRLRNGEAAILFNGNGAEYASRITHIDKQGVTVEILNKDIPLRESPLNITLAQAISAG
jgi:16S rRNA (uracil1498-N3)-methyltransferase